MDCNPLLAFLSNNSTASAAESRAKGVEGAEKGAAAALGGGAPAPLGGPQRQRGAGNMEDTMGPKRDAPPLALPPVALPPVDPGFGSMPCFFLGLWCPHRRRGNFVTSSVPAPKPLLRYYAAPRKASTHTRTRTTHTDLLRTALF